MKKIEENVVSTTTEENEKFVSLINVNKFYDKKVHAVTDFSLDIKKHEFIVFVGPSGCGKSTTLRMIAGLEDISSGELYIDGMFSNNLSPKDRDIAMVFQSYALYPNMTVFDNIAFGLKVRKVKKEEIKERVEEAARILEISELLKRKPKALSGGQRQRVALGRAIVRRARLFLMDEPLSNLDAKLRVQMRSEIISLHERIKATTIYVTHDQTEAMTMADRIVVMKLGVVQQIGTPLEIYRNPSNKFVASFIGSPAMNFLSGIYNKGVITFLDGTSIKVDKEIVKKHNQFYQEKLNEYKLGLNDFIEARKQEFLQSNKKTEYNQGADEEVAKRLALIDKFTKICEGEPHAVTFGIRPENIVRVPKKTESSFTAEVLLSELLGDEYYVHFNYGGKSILSKVATEDLIEKGSIIELELQLDKAHLFDDDTEIAIC